MATYNLINNKTQNINLTGLTSAQLASALASLSAFESAVESGTRSTKATLTVGSDTYNIAKGKTNAKVDFTYDGIKFADYASLTAYIADEVNEAGVLTTAEAVAAALASDKTTLTAANTTLASEKAALTAANAALTAANAALTTSNNTLQGYLAGFGDANADGLLDAQTINLTVGIDERTGSNFNDTFNAYAVSSNPTAPNTLFSTLTAMDRIDGGLGQDTLNVVEVNAINTTTVTGLQLTGIEAVSLRSNGAITAITNGWTGTTSLTTDNSAGTAAAQILTAGLSTTVSALGSGDLTITGGSDVTATTLSGAVTVGSSIGAVTVTNLAQVANTISINGGTNVNVSSAGNAAGNITIGNTTAPSGTILVNASTGAAATIGLINVTGGTSVEINQSAFNAVNTTSIAGAVTVTGGAATTSVTVTDTAAAAAAPAVAGHTNGTVTINDANSADLLLPGTIATVTLNSYGQSTIDSSAIATVNLSGTGGTLGIGRGNLTAVPTANTLALNVNALSGGAITDTEAAADDGFTTINLANTGTSVIANLTAADLTTLNISGSGSLSLTANTLGGATTTAITSTSTGSVTLGAALNAATAYTGGSGADTITVGATANAIATNGGDDTVILTSATLAAGGSINAGAAGSDTLQTTALIAATASATAPLGAVFTAAVSGFEKLVLTGGGNNTVDVSRIGAFSDISTAGDTLLTLDGVTSGSTLRLTATGTAQTINTTTALTAGTADSLNAVLTGVTTLGNVAFGSLTATNIENINVNSGYDSSMTAANITAATTGGFANQLTILGNNAQSIVVSGAAGLNLTAASTALTLVDASSNTVGSAGEFSWTSGATTGAVTVRGLVSGINTVNLSNATVAGTYTGSADADTVTIANALANVLTLGNGTNLVNGAATGNNTVTGGSGSDTFITATVGNNIINFGDGTNAFTATTGNNTYTGGAGNDTVNVTTGNNTVTLGDGTNIFNATTGNNTVTGGSGDDTVVTTTGNNIVSLGNGTNSFTATAGANTYTGGTGIDTIVTGAGADIIIGGGGADLITAGAGADRITVSGATATITQAAGASGTNTSTTVQTAQLTSTFDVIFGAAAGLTINLGNAAIVTAGLTLAGANLAAGAADTAVFARGTYDAANGIFSYGAAGLDTAITYDSAAAAGVTAETIILVGYATGATTVAAGVLTLA